MDSWERHHILVLKGMHGILTYSTHPEKILSFRVVEQKLRKANVLCLPRCVNLLTVIALSIPGLLAAYK